MGRASAQVKMTAASDTTIVSIRRSPITSFTGRFHSMAMPKLPWSIWPHPPDVLHDHGPVQPVLLAQRDWISRL